MCVFVGKRWWKEKQEGAFPRSVGHGGQGGGNIREAELCKGVKGLFPSPALKAFRSRSAL